jgi:hypothetical protein
VCPIISDHPQGPRPQAASGPVFCSGVSSLGEGPRPEVLYVQCRCRVSESTTWTTSPHVLTRKSFLNFFNPPFPSIECENHGHNESQMTSLNHALSLGPSGTIGDFHQNDHLPQVVSREKAGGSLVRICGAVLHDIWHQKLVLKLPIFART